MFKDSDIKILNKLVGQVTGPTAANMSKNLECFLHPAVSIFIPSYGYCEYAITPSHTHPAYTFIYYFQPVTDFIVEEKHLAYDLTNGKCLSAMSPGIHHQEIEEEYFQSYIAIAIDAAFFQEIALQYMANRLYHQIQQNSKVEAAFIRNANDPVNFESLHVTGTVEIVQNEELHKRLFKERSWLWDNIKNAEVDTEVVIFRIAHGSAYIWNMSWNIKEKDAPRIEF